MATLRLVAAVVVLAGAAGIVGLAACGGAVLSGAQSSDADADIAESSVQREAPHGDSGFTQRPDASVTSIADASLDVATDADDDAADTAASGCAPVRTGCMGAASCGANSDPMPIACADGTTYEQYCRTRTHCGAGPAYMLDDAGSFYCYSCNP